MSEHLSSGEAKRKRIEDYGDPLGLYLHHLENAFTSSIVEFNLFKGLFASCPERVETLNQASGLVATTMSRVLFSSIILSICRITDPATTGRGASASSNLTLEQLGVYLPDSLKNDYDTLRLSAKEAAGFARARRNKIIAHADVGYALSLEEPPTATVGKVQESLKKMEECLHFITQKLNNSTCLYFDVITQLDDHRTLIRSLFLGNRVWADYLHKKNDALKKGDVAQFDELEAEHSLPEWVMSRP